MKIGKPMQHSTTAKKILQENYSYGDYTSVRDKVQIQCFKGIIDSPDTTADEKSLAQIAIYPSMEQPIDKTALRNNVADAIMNPSKKPSAQVIAETAKKASKEVIMMMDSKRIIFNGLYAVISSRASSDEKDLAVLGVRMSGAMAGYANLLEDTVPYAEHACLLMDKVMDAIHTPVHGPISQILARLTVDAGRSTKKIEFFKDSALNELDFQRPILEGGLQTLLDSPGTKAKEKKEIKELLTYTEKMSDADAVRQEFKLLKSIAK